MVDIYHHEHHNEDVDKFGNLLECNADSPSSKYFKKYIAFAAHLLGYSYTPLTWKNAAPSVMEHYETASRDPALYQLMKKVSF